MMNYPLAKTSWDKEELEAIQAVVKTGHYSMGPFVFKFEEQFAKFVGSKYCVMVNSGSSANLLAIAACFYTKNPFLKRGDEVIVPALSWSTTYSPLYQYGLKLKFVDIDKHTLNFDLKQLETAIGQNTKAIFAPNILGNPNDFAAIKRIIGTKNIILLEDNCESLGATFEGKQAGTFGLMGTFSTFFSHHMATMEGGMIVTDNEELHHILLCLRAHGWTRNLPTKNKVTGTKSANAFEESFKFVLPGYNVRPVEMSGAIGIEQLKKLPSFIKDRVSNARIFVEHFKNHPYLTIQKEIGASSWFGFSLIVNENCPVDRATLLRHLDTLGIETRPVVTGDFTKNSVIKYFDYELAGEMTNAQIVDQRGFFIGNHHGDMAEQVRWVAKNVNSFLKV
jgi:CDP-6-deoxy-D-xylo-4-hexulose-3-dehydrase